MSELKIVFDVNLDSPEVVVYKPKQIPLQTSVVAQNFIASPKFQDSDFEINPLVAQQSGVTQLQKNKTKENIDQEVLRQFKLVEDKAHKEGFQAGLLEGRQLALEEQRELLREKILQWDQLMHQFENMKSILVADHEVHIVQMVYQLAKKLALREISLDATSIFSVILMAVKETQNDENLIVRLSDQDFNFIQELKEKIPLPQEVLKRLKFESSEEMAPGGVFLISNYGTVDAKIETRIEQAWNLLKTKWPSSEVRTSTEGNHGD